MDALGHVWISYIYEGTWFVALTDDENHALRMHPIGFEDEREADRAAKRLNERDGY